jgi:tetratricopeptide (TPR) repeat protein
VTRDLAGEDIPGRSVSGRGVSARDGSVRDGSASAEPLRFAAWIAVLLLTLYLVFVGGGWQGIYTTTIRQVSVALAGLSLATWVATALLRPGWRPSSVLLPVIAACLGAFAISTVTSRYPRVSVEYLGYAILLAALYLLLVRLLAAPFFRTRFGALAVGLCLVLALGFPAQVLSLWLAWWGLVGHLTVPPLRPGAEGLTFGNNAVLTITVLFFAPAVAHLGTDTAVRRFVVSALVLLVGLVAILSGSRAGWFGIAAAAVIVGGLWLATARGRATIRDALGVAVRSGRARIAAASLAVIAVVGIVAIAPSIIRRASEGGEDIRAGFLAAAIRMFAEAPADGTGPGTWVIQRIRYTSPSDLDLYVPHAHDIYAQTLAEFGFLGAAAGLVLVAGLVWLVRDAVRDGDPVRRRWGWMAAFSLVYFGAHQLFDFYANMPAILFAAALPVAWLDATATSGPRVAGRALPQRLWGIPAAVAAVVLLVAVVGLEATEVPAGTHAQAVALANAGDWVTADAPARAAVATDPDWPPYLMTEGLTAAWAGDHARAADAFRRVVASDDLPEAWLDLAAEEAALGNLSAAESALGEALRLGSQRPAVSVPAGDLALRIGNRELAMQAFTRALLAVPSLAGDPWWASDPLRAAIFPEVREAAIERAGPGGWEIALASGDFIGARSLAEQLDQASAANAAQVIDAWTGDAAAFQAVLDQCAARPLDITALWWCARLEGHAGDDGEANRYRAWANTIVGGAYVAGAELRVRQTVQIGRSEAGNPALFYGYYTYRRPTPWDLLVPSLVHLTLE